MAQKIIVISGCSSGMGLAAAIHFAKDDQKRYKVFATVRETSNIDELKREAGATLNKTLFIRFMDISIDESVKNFFSSHFKEEGRVDVLVANAGITFAHLTEFAPMDLIRSHYNVNVFGTMRVIQSCLPDMKKRNSGQMIINSSVNGSIVPMAVYDVYSSGKYAVEGFAMSLAPMLKKFNIKISVFSPGPVKTAILDKSSKSGYGSFEDMLNQDMDEKTREVVQICSNGTETAFAIAQDPKEVAGIISKIVCSDKPSFRYFTHPFYEAIAREHFVDPSGDSYVMKLCDVAKTIGYMQPS